MIVHHLRNATCVLELGPHKILVDPMLGEPGTLPGFRMFRGKRRANPLVPLPQNAAAALQQVTCALLTHRHPDHLDRAATDWLKEQELPIFVHEQDRQPLIRKSLKAIPFSQNELGIEAKPVSVKHGPGIVGKLMGKGTGWLLRYEQEPDIYITGDTILTPDVKEVIRECEPQVILAPAGAANFGIGPDILFSLEELVELARLASGKVIFNHQEALDHCLLTRDQLNDALESAGLRDKCIIPEDGQIIDLTPEHP